MYLYWLLLQFPSGKFLSLGLSNRRVTLHKSFQQIFQKISHVNKRNAMNCTCVTYVFQLHCDKEMAQGLQ